MALILAGCASAPPQLTNDVLAQFTDDASAPESNATWWEALKEPMLNELVKQSLAGNFSVQAAAQRLEAAKLGDEATFWSLAPKGSLDSRRSYSKLTTYSQDSAQFKTPLPPARGTTTSNFSASWEVPLFGKAQAIGGLQTAQHRQAHWQLEGAKLAVAAEVVRTYSELQAADHLVAHLNHRKTLLEELRANESQVVAAGVSTQAEVDKWTTELVQLAQEHEDLKAQNTKLRARLATLAGLPKVPLPPSLADTPLMTAPVVQSISAETLRQRPDVRVSEATVGIAAAQAGIAKASLWPQLTLGGTANLLQGSLDTSGLSRGTSGSIAVSAGLSIPLLDWFALRVQSKIRAKELEAAVSEYRQTVLSAWEEARGAFASYAQSLAKTQLAQSALQLQESEAVRQQALFTAGAGTRSEIARAAVGTVTRAQQLTEQRAASVQAWALLQKAIFARQQVATQQES